MTADALVECVPNFSEGQDPARVRQIVAAMAVEGVHLLDFSMDVDHNRSVVTIVGPPAAVVESAVRGVGKAAELIDLTRQAGQHPRIGAADVVPFVPVRAISLAECAILARQAGREVWKRFGVPVYFYGAAAVRPDRAELEAVRRGQFEGLREAVKGDVSRRPDVGGPGLHGTAGASAVGARPFLIAFNVFLAALPPPDASEKTDVTVARAIARELRASSGGLAAVKAIGLLVDGRAQVSMNLTNHELMPVERVYTRLEELAFRHGVGLGESELIGLVPQTALDVKELPRWAASIPGFQPERKVLEQRMRAPLPWPGSR